MSGAMNGSMNDAANAANAANAASGRPKPVRLVDLERPVGEVELPSGRTVPVRAIDGAGYELRESLARGEASDADIWHLARRVLPGATEEEIRSLTPTMVGVVAEIACGHLNAVLAYARSQGKSPAPAETNALEAAPAPGTPTPPTPPAIPATPAGPADGSPASSPSSRARRARSRTR